MLPTQHTSVPEPLPAKTTLSSVDGKGWRPGGHFLLLFYRGFCGSRRYYSDCLPRLFRLDPRLPTCVLVGGAGKGVDSGVMECAGEFGLDMRGDEVEDDVKDWWYVLWRALGTGIVYVGPGLQGCALCHAHCRCADSPTTFEPLPHGQ